MSLLRRVEEELRRWPELSPEAALRRAQARETLERMPRRVASTNFLK